MIIKFKEGGEFLASQVEGEDKKLYFYIVQRDAYIRSETTLNLESTRRLYKEIKLYLEQFSEKEDEDAED